MEIILSLITIYCNNHFNYKGCFEDRKVCIESYTASALNKPRFSLNVSRKLNQYENDVLAAAYTECTQPVLTTCE